jgi:hypothetical protein
MGEKLEPKIGNVENIQTPIVVMKPLGNNSSYISSFLLLLGTVGILFFIGYAWIVTNENKTKIDIALTTKKEQQEKLTQERQQREAYYQGMNEQILSNQEQEAENARIAWEHYHQEQKRLEQERKINEILALEEQQNSGRKSYWKCTDNTGETIYSVEPCQIEGKVISKQVIVDTHNVNIIHNPNPVPTVSNVPKVITKNVYVYKHTNNQANNNKINSVDCQNAKRAWKFESSNPYQKSFNIDRLRKDVWVKCGTWPSDL